jgi:hypothetical protein
MSTPLPGTKQVVALVEGTAVEECLTSLIKESGDLKVQAGEALALRHCIRRATPAVIIS